MSTDENTVSAYATTDDTGNVTVVLVNRALSGTTSTSVALTNVSLPDGAHATLQLANLPPTETAVSHTANALTSRTVNLTGNQFSVTLPALSITSVRLTQLTETPPPVSGASRLANVSVRAKSGTGDNVLIVGFVIGGTGSKEILQRGIGPSLKQLGIASPLADPELTLVSQKTGPITSKDNWGSDALQNLAGRQAPGSV